jgi:solute carrier family 13 (sodium-dependent dicarboxylate transporter), member 2/3/5
LFETALLFSGLRSQNFFRIASFCSGPLAFLLILFLVPANVLGPDSGKALAVAAWMVIWWITEAAPIPVTALLPLLLFPFLGVMKMSEAAAPYANPIIFLFMGGFLIAMALEKHRLHERIALNLIRITGTSGNGIILGFMLATAVLSMWISNTATAIMMLPIAGSVINLLKTDPTQSIHELAPRERNLALGLMLSIGYAATIGGMATLIGTPPNAVFKGLFEQHYQQTINFGEWMLVGVPVTITLLCSTYVIVTRILFRNRIILVEGTDLLLREKLAALGQISRTEKRVLAIFAFTSLLWILQEGVNALIGRALLNDSNVAMLGGILMFLVPADLTRMEFILDWKDTRMLQWGILILFGGGLCLATGLQNTGIIQTLGLWIAQRSVYDAKLILLLIVASVVLTEIMSNVALVQIFIPVIFGIADGLNVNPILLAMPVTLGSSIAFMFPISTPPNAIVFSSGYIRIRDMARAGILLNLVSILIILVFSLTLVDWVFG